MLFEATIDIAQRKIEIATQKVNLGKPVYLKDLWPTEAEIQETMQRAVTAEMFKRSYNDVFTGDERWQKLPIPDGNRYAWDTESTYIRKPTFLEGMTMTPPTAGDVGGGGLDVA